MELIAVDMGLTWEGSDSDIAVLSTARKEVLHSISLAVKKTLVEKTGESTYVFTNDTVHQAFYESLGKQPEATKLHLKIGKFLWDRLLRQQTEDYDLFLTATVLSI